MSATVIDALLVTLGLDPSAFTAGTKEVTKDLDKLKKESESTSKSMAEEGKKAAEFFRSVRNEMLALIGVTLTLKGIKDILIDTTHSMADLGRVSNIIGESARTVDAWGNAVKGFGGDAKTMQATMLGLEDSITSFKMTGQGNSTIATFRSMGIQFMDEHGNARKSSDLLMDVSKYFEKVHATPQAARQFGKMLGIDQGTINMLMQGSEATKRYVAEQEKLSAVNAQSIRNAQEMERAWANLDSQWQSVKLTLTEALQPEIKEVTRLLGEFSTWVTNHRSDIHHFFDELPGKIKPVTDEISKAVDAVGGWNNALNILLVFTAGKWALGMLGAVGKVVKGFGPLLAAIAIASAWDKLATNEEAAKKEHKSTGQFLVDKMHQKEKERLESGDTISDRITKWWNNVTTGVGKPLPPELQQLASQSSTWSSQTPLINTFQTGADPEQYAQSAKIHRAVGKGAALLGMMAGTFGQLEAQYNLPTGLLNSVATTESAGNQFAVSPAGAEGLFQLMPGTAKGLGLKEGDEFDPQKSSEAAARYLSSLLKMFHGNINAALAAYNWGPGNVAKKGLDHLPQETQAYLQKVNGGMPVGASSRYAFAPPAAASSPASRQVTNETHIGVINVQTQATDAQGMAKELPGALRRNPLIYQADSGMS